PSFARRLTMAAPIPRLPPVTSARLPLNGWLMLLLGKGGVSRHSHSFAQEWVWPRLGSSPAGGGRPGGGGGDLPPLHTGSRAYGEKVRFSVFGSRPCNRGGVRKARTTGIKGRNRASQMAHLPRLYDQHALASLVERLPKASTVAGGATVSSSPWRDTP